MTKCVPKGSRLKELAAYEKEHEDNFRELIGAYLGKEPSTGLAATHSAKGAEGILNLKAEKEAIDFYKSIYKKLNEHRSELQYEVETLEHEIRNVIIDEQEHVAEISRLLGI